LELLGKLVEAKLLSLTTSYIILAMCTTRRHKQRKRVFILKDGKQQKLDYTVKGVFGRLQVKLVEEF